MTRQRAMLLLFPPLALLAVLLSVFGRLSVPLLTSPAFTLASAVVLIGLVPGIVAAALVPSAAAGRVRRLVFAGVLALIVFALVDVAAGGNMALVSIAESRLGRAALVAGAFLAVTAFLRVTGAHAGPLLFVGAVALLASTGVRYPAVFSTAAAEPPLSTSSAPTTQPPLVYILLDAGMGTEGLGVSPHGRAAADDLRAVFARHRFRLYGGAFSRHFVSARAIPNALNFDFSDDSWGPQLVHQTNLTVDSRLFARLANQGYDVVSYTTEHIDFCFADATRCEVLRSFNPSSPYVQVDRIRLASLAQIVWSALPGSYILYTGFDALSSFLEASGWPPGLTFIDTYAFPGWFTRFERDITSSPRGHAYFAHMLVPHSPFVFGAGCEDTGAAVVGDYLVEVRHLGGADFDAARDEAYRAYAQQYQCVARRLDDLLTTLDALPEFDDATIVIHGDHGGRISAGQYAETVSDRDMIDNYSALYAIRKPGVEPGYDTRKTSVQRLMAEYFSPEADTLPADDPTVVIDSEVGEKVVVREMPDFGDAVSP